MQIDETITIVDYDKRWPRNYEREAARLYNALGDEAVGIEHFGSTSVPGMAAKPIVDILIGVRSLTPPPSRLEALARLGYEGFGEAGVPGRLYFRKRGELAFNLAVVIWNGEQWRNNLMIRDHLRRNPTAAETYAVHKRSAIARGKTTLLAYSDEKADFVRGLLEQALRAADGGGPTV